LRFKKKKYNKFRLYTASIFRGMESYTRSEVVSPPELRTNLPFSCLPDNYIHMTVKAGSKLRNIIGYAIKNFQVPEANYIVFSGSGEAIIKTISCAEILKKKFKNLHQINKIEYIVCEEMWTPKIKDLDRLKVKRDIPAIHVLLSKQPLDASEPGYQPPGACNAFWTEGPKKKTSKQPRKPKPGDRSERGGDENWRKKKGNRGKGKPSGGSSAAQPSSRQVEGSTIKQEKTDIETHKTSKLSTKKGESSGEVRQASASTERHSARASPTQGNDGV